MRVAGRLLAGSAMRIVDRCRVSLVLSYFSLAQLELDQALPIYAWSVALVKPLKAGTGLAGLCICYMYSLAVVTIKGRLMVVWLGLHLCV